MMASVLQFSENLTDRQAAEAVRDRITWKYALGLRMRSASLMRQINHLAPGDFKTVTLDRPGPHNRPKVHEDPAVKLTSYPGTVRQLIVTGLGRRDGRRRLRGNALVEADRGRGVWPVEGDMPGRSGLREHRVKIHQ
jgi:hypothetical protein